MGVTIHGLFIEQAIFTRDDGTIAVCVYVACGRASYGVFMKSSHDVELLDKEKQGTEIDIAARPYVNKNGKLGWVDGEVLNIG